MEESETNFLRKNRKLIVLASGIYMVILSFFFIGSFMENLYPIGFSEKSLFLFPKDITNYYLLKKLFNFPFHVYSLFFGLATLSFVFMNKEDTKILFPIVLFLNFLFSLPFFIIPVVTEGLFSFYHLIYFVLIILMLMTLRKEDFGFAKNGFVIIYPVLFFLCNFTFTSIIQGRSSNNSLTAVNVRDSINIRSAVAIPETQERRWISPNPRNGKIRVVLFGDFNCPDCQELNRLVEQMRKSHISYSSFEYYAFPSSRECNSLYTGASDSGEISCLLSKYALCSNKSTFPLTYQTLSEAGPKLTKEELLKRARSGGYIPCIEGAKSEQMLKDDLEIANKLKITEPTIFLNGIRITRPFNEKKFQNYFTEIRRRLSY